ncbi:RNA polymerase sigma factor [Chitinophaga solisilvae]|uniref:Sigma-70 family RNA polymerase sigma factor n=1 Tax=Chitinophaga solisilvae TaxID=1233460 RepID=A0A3S1AZW4_9BACT|nr:sigma-70 family RNA polymerase sigma factor [Chitinophaga solisilvae]NSL90669.1 sigma-70 family RNA polymerase sigma factor [Chitinophaga solisilvae]
MPAMKDKFFSDDDLWKRFKSGDRSAFALIYQEYTVYLFQYGFRFCDDREKLKDIIQDLFVEMWNSREALSEKVMIRFYLCRSLKYKLLRANYQFRSKTGRQHQYLHEQPATITESTVEDKLIDAENNACRSVLLENAIRKLSRRQQEIITLRFYMGFTNAEIADLMHMKYQSVSNLLYNALNRIKETLQTSPLTVRLLETLRVFFI